MLRANNHVFVPGALECRRPCRRLFDQRNSGSGLYAHNESCRRRLADSGARPALFFASHGRPIVPGGEAGKPFRLPGKASLSVAILAFIALFSEGALQDWAAVYMRQVVVVPVPVAAIGYAGYSTAMALGRFVGDRVVTFFGERLVMRLSGTLIIVGQLAALLIPSPTVAIAGFAVAGLGNSNLVPILFTAAGRDPVLGPGPASPP